ncbi:MAG: hypothetical protein K1Y36_21580 [Blastocatellia bacterium]|nr:hypothetical protein [Blastocatellia bacterium]
MPIKEPNAKSTKNEILEAFEQVAKENQKIKSEVEALRKEKRALEAAVPAKIEPPAPQGGAKPVMPAPSTTATIEQVITNIETLQAGFGTALSGLSGKLIDEASQLEELREKTNNERTQLAELYGIQLSDTTLADLVTEHSQKATDFEEELKAKRAAIEADLTARQQGWKKELEEHTTSVTERNNQSRKNRARDIAEYRYRLEQERALEKETYELQKQQREQELLEQREAVTATWTKREETIAEQEKQFEEAKAKVEGFPKELEAAVKKAREEGAGIARAQAKNTADLLAKEVEGRKRLAELRIESLESTIGKQTGQIERLAAQLAGAMKQVQDLAVKAIEGASNESSFQAIREIAIEQAKTQNKNK